METVVRCLPAVPSRQIASIGQSRYLSTHNIAHDGRKSFRQGVGRRVSSASPSDTAPARNSWPIRINDFPDELVYSLMIGNETAGGFHDWQRASEHSLADCQSTENCGTCFDGLSMNGFFLNDFNP